MAMPPIFVMTQRIIHQNEFPYHLTFNTTYSVPLFENGEYAFLLRKIIINACELKRFDCIAFAILPNHVHILVIKRRRALEKARGGIVIKNNVPSTPQHGLSSPRDVKTISHLAQSIKGNFSRKLHQGRVWQPWYNFRIVDSDHRFENTLNYIVHNYQKHGLNEKYGRKPYVYLNIW